MAEGCAHEVRRQLDGLRTSLSRIASCLNLQKPVLPLASVPAASCASRSRRALRRRPSRVPVSLPFPFRSVPSSSASQRLFVVLKSCSRLGIVDPGRELLAEHKLDDVSDPDEPHRSGTQVVFARLDVGGLHGRLKVSRLLTPEANAVGSWKGAMTNA